VNIIVLGRGKTGSLVADAVRERGHLCRVLGSAENAIAAALTADSLRDVAVVMDFTTPAAVLENISACARAGKDMVVGTTGWYDEIQHVRRTVEDSGMGFVYGANFSVGVNLFFDVARAASSALNHRYSGQIFERHHAQKRDAPSGTAIALRNVLQANSFKASADEIEITSFREGDVVGMHEIVLESANDRIYLCHDSKSRRGFAEGAVRAAEWLVGKKGFFDFKDIWREM
jgi:4-hydroxy-tetrahydrodipicolinate reductase